MANPDTRPMTPAAALARHLEWLEYALTAAREEEDRRRGRLDRATSKNRDKRAVRLAEVRAEVDELSALVQGIKDLQAATAPATKVAAKRGPKPGSKAPARRRASSAAAAKAGTTTRPVLDGLDVHAPPRDERGRRAGRDEAPHLRDEARRRRRDHRRDEWHRPSGPAEAPGLVGEADHHRTKARDPIEDAIDALAAVDDAAFGPSQLTAS